MKKLERKLKLNFTILPSLVLLYGSSPAIPWNFLASIQIWQLIRHVESGYTDAGSLPPRLPTPSRFSLTLQVYVS